MKKGRKEVFGDISAPGGGIIWVEGGDMLEGLTFVTFESLKAIAVSQKITLVPEFLVQLKIKAREEAMRIIENMKAKGVPEKFIKLFGFKKKKEVNRYCRELTVTHEEFALLATNFEQIGMSHKRHHFEHVPKELKTSEDEKIAFRVNGLGAFASKSAIKFIQKISATFKQRKNINAHLFEGEGGWHLFWFTFDDINAGATGKAPHWSGGDHIHYTSSLWGHDLMKIWMQIQEGKYSIAGTHIRYLDPRTR